MAEVVAVTSGSLSSAQIDSQFVAVVAEKLADNHYIIKVNNSYIEVVSPTAEFEVGDQLMLKILSSSPEKIELKVINTILSEADTKAIELLQKFNIPVTEQNMEIIKALLRQEITPDKTDVRNILQLLHSAGENLSQTKELINLLLKNNIIPSRSIIKQLLTLTKGSNDSLVTINQFSSTEELANGIRELIRFQLAPHRSLTNLIRQLETLIRNDQQQLQHDQLLFKLLNQPQGSQKESEILPAKFEGFMDRSQNIKFLNTLNSIAGENRLYAEIPISNNAQNNMIKMLYDKKNSPDKKREGSHTIYIGVSLEKSGDILTRLNFQSDRYKLDIYTENEATMKAIKNNVQKLSDGLSAQGFKGSINVHMEKGVEFPPIFKASESELDLFI